MRVLVTGGAGFIGSHIVDLLIGEGHQVTVVDDLSTGRLENIHPDATFVKMDIASPALGTFFDFDAVVHQAAQPGVPRSLADPLFDAKVNIVGTVALLELCRQRNVRRFVFASSAAVYGTPEQLPIPEDAPKSPLSPYGLAKLSAERYTLLYHQLYGLETVALRYGNVYGPRQDACGEAGVVSIFINDVLQGKQPEIHGDGLQTRDFVYVADIARANLLALAPETPTGVFNVGSGVATHIVDLFDMINNGRMLQVFGPARSGDIRDSVLDVTAIHHALNWSAAVHLAEGLAKTWEYFADQSTLGAKEAA